MRRSPAPQALVIRRAATVLAVALAVATSPAARANDSSSGDAALPQATPGADQIQFAAQEHDLGYRAYVEGRYEEAATHFENAFFSAPNPAELRSAVRARREGGDLARAATLAAIGERKFPGDTATTKLADEVLTQARPRVYEVQVRSRVPCWVAIDEKVVTSERMTDFRFFVDPGKHELLVSWSDDRNERVPFEATAGESRTLILEATPQESGPAVVPPAPAPAAVSVLAPPRIRTEAPAPSVKPFGPPVFVAGVVLTAAAAGVTIWSGIDTLNNPGRDAVRRDCAGLYERCPEYQKGVDAQVRTNVLIAATGGLAAATGVVGLFFTQWPRAVGTTRTGVGLRPLLGWGRAGLQGTF